MKIMRKAIDLMGCTLEGKRGKYRLPSLPPKSFDETKKVVRLVLFVMCQHLPWTNFIFHLQHSTIFMRAIFECINDENFYGN